MFLTLKIVVFFNLIIFEYVVSEDPKVEVVSYTDEYDEFLFPSENIRNNAIQYVKIIESKKDADILVFPKYGLTSTKPVKSTFKDLDDFAIENLENLKNACPSTLPPEANEEVIQMLSCAAIQHQKHLVVHFLEKYRDNYTSTIVHIDNKGFLHKKDNRSFEYDRSLKLKENSQIPVIKIKNTIFELHMLLDILKEEEESKNSIIYYTPLKFYLSEFFYVQQIDKKKFYVVENMERDFNKAVETNSELDVSYTYTDLNKSTIGWNKIEKDGCKIDYYIGTTSDNIEYYYQLATYTGSIFKNNLDNYTICALVKTEMSEQLRDCGIFNFINISTETDSTQKYFTGIQLNQFNDFEPIKIDTSETTDKFLKITAKDVKLYSFGFIYKKNINKEEKEKEKKMNNMYFLLLLLLLLPLIIIIICLVRKKKNNPR